MFSTDSVSSSTLSTEVIKLKTENKLCAVCDGGGELFTPEEHDAGSPHKQAPLRSMLLRLNYCKVIPEGRYCSTCIQRAVEGYEFSTKLSVKTAPPLHDKIRLLRQRLHELTQTVDVSIAVGVSEDNPEGTYNEGNIIVVDRDKIAAAVAADEQEQAQEQAGNAFEEAMYKCAVCSMTFQTLSELRAHRPVCCFWCPACGAACSGRSGLSRHVSRVHAQPPGILLCYKCFQQQPTLAQLKKHELTHREAIRFVCGYDSCILIFNNRVDLISHVRSVHTNEVVKPRPTCPECGRKFRTAFGLKRHARMHRRERFLNIVYSESSE